jgi:hypothetical protein
MNMNSEDYDLKKSKSKIGEIYPVIKDAKGRIIDGKHRKEADPNWREEDHPEVDTDEKFILWQMHSNWQRREVTWQEKANWINRLAAIYQNEGYKALITGNEIVKKIMEVTGLSQPTVNAYLADEYKVYTSKDRKRRPEISAHERIQHEFGDELMERLEQEVERKLLLSERHHASPEELLEKKNESIISELSDKNEKMKLREETKLYNLTPEQTRERIAEIQTSKIRTEPAIAGMFKAQPEITMGRICPPLERFVTLDVNILIDLNNEQKQKVLTVLSKTQKKIDEMIRVLRG